MSNISQRRRVEIKSDNELKAAVFEAAGIVDIAEGKPKQGIYTNQQIADLVKSPLQLVNLLMSLPKDKDPQTRRSILCEVVFNATRKTRR